MRWWRRLWHRRSLDAQLERELKAHLDHHIDELVARGVHPAEARRRASLALGGVEQVKEACRDVRGTQWLEDLLHDSRHAVRTYMRMPGFVAIALLILALGIAATTVMFTVVDGVLLKPLAYPEPERLFAMKTATDQLGEFWRVSLPDFDDASREVSALTMTAWTYGGGTISEPGEPEYLSGRRISASFFSVFGVPVIHGRAFLPEDDRRGAAPVAMISAGFAARRFGTTAQAIGRPIVFDGRACTIVGIAPAGVDPTGDADIYTPLRQETDPRLQNRQARFLLAVARLRPGANLAEAQGELAAVTVRLTRDFAVSNTGVSLQARPLQPQLVGNVRSTLWLVLAAVGFVLLIACINLASLLVARAVSREREVAMRVALGAGRGRLMRQCLAESAVLALTGGVLGVVLAAIAVGPIVAWWPDSLPRVEAIGVDWRVCLFTLAVSLASGLLVGLAPALRAPVADVEPVLRGGARTIGGSSRHLQRAFVASELAIAVVLLVAAGTLGRTLLRLTSLDPGLSVKNLLTTRFALSPSQMVEPEQMRAAWQDIVDRARRVPGVDAVALTDIVPMRVGENTLPYSTTASVVVPGAAPVALASAVSPTYLDVMGIPLRRGRFFDDHDRVGGQPVIVIDEGLAQHAFGTVDVVGRPLWIPAMGSTPQLIVGVVGHVRHWGLAGDERSRVRDQIYYPFAQVPSRLMHVFSSVMSIVVRTNVPPAMVVDPLRRELRGASNDQALYDVVTMEQLAGASLARQRFLVITFGIFAGVALLLACVGVYGVLAYITSQRLPELGVRIALGATAFDVMRLVMRQSLAMIAVGVAIGGAVAWGVGRILARLVDGVRPTDATTFAIMIAVLIAAAMIASFVPARRAGRVDPLQALRQS